MPARDPQRRVLQSRTAAAIRHGRPDADDLRRQLAAVRLEEYIHAVLVTAPPLRDSQRQRLVATLGVQAPTCPSCGIMTTTLRATS